MAYDFNSLDKVKEEQPADLRYYRDYTNIVDTIPEVEAGKKDNVSMTLAQWIRQKGYGRDVRESIAQFVEWVSVLTNKAIDKVDDNAERQTTVEEQFQSLLNETTSKDVISAPEIIAARGGKATLGQRLDETTAQLAEKVNKDELTYVTPEMFGAVGDGVTDDKNAFEKALSCDKKVILSSKIYAVSGINTEVAENVCIIGNGKSTIKWLITDSTKYNKFDGMISDDYGTSYEKHGNVFLKGVTFDGNSDKIINYDTGLRGLCIFWSRNNILIENCTFKNSPNDGFMFRDCRGKIEVKNCTFDTIGIYNPNNGTRNGMTLSGGATNTECCALISNCTFKNIADECMRVDTITTLNVQNCVFEKIGHHVVEAGEKNAEYVAKILNCKGSYIGSGIYSQGAHGKGAEKKGLVSIDNCYFDNLVWTGSNALYKRDTKSIIVNAIGDTKDLTGDVEINNSTFISITEKAGLNTFPTDYGIIGANITLLNVKIEYKVSNVDRFIYPTSALSVINSTVKVNTTSGYGVIYIMMENVELTLHNTYIELNGTALGENNADTVIRVTSGKTRIIIDNCIANVGGKSFVHYINGSASNESIVIIKSSKLTGTAFNVVINYESTETYIPVQIVVVDNIVSSCKWNKMINGTATLLTCTRNNNYNL